MRIRYRLPVSGRLRIDASFPVTTKLFTFTFETDAIGLVKYLNAATQADDRDLWPRATPAPQPGIKFHFHLSSPFFAELQRHVRAISGLLSLYGVDEISVDRFEQIWEPENDEEKNALPVYSFQINRQATSASNSPVMPFDLVARTVLAADMAGGFDAALNFFRKGRIDVLAEQYLDAVVDYLFMIETTYANGKFRSNHVQDEYLSSLELLRLIAEAVSNPALLSEVGRDSRMHQRFKEAYEGKTPEEIVHYLVNLRGELHHHSGRKSGVWHPTDHNRFGADAYFLEYLCLGIASSITREAMFGQKTVEAYQEQARMNMAAGKVQRHRRDA
jgi:hypothetical protein